MYRNPNPVKLQLLNVHQVASKSQGTNPESWTALWVPIIHAFWDWCGEPKEWLDGFTACGLAPERPQWKYMCSAIWQSDEDIYNYCKSCTKALRDSGYFEANVAEFEANIAELRI